MSVFVLAPLGADLQSLPSEAQELVNLLSGAGYRVHLMQEPATELELYRALDKGPFSLVWMGAHSSAEGFMLDKGVLTPDALGRFLAEAQARDLVLNSCFSAGHVDAIQRYTTTNIVATIKPEGIEDREAWRTALYLGRALARTKSLHAAYLQVSAGGMTQYRWFPAVQAVGWGQQTMSDRSDARMERIEETTERLVRALQGDPFSRSPGLIETIQSLQNEMSAYIRADAEWKRQTEENIRALQQNQQQQGPLVVLSLRAVWAIILSIILLLAVLILLVNLLAGRL